jgi:hypothetical protein
MGCELTFPLGGSALAATKCLLFLMLREVPTRVSNLAGRQGFEPR